MRYWLADKINYRENVIFLFNITYEGDVVGNFICSTGTVFKYINDMTYILDEC